jgi:hypothetical protein
MRKETMSEAIGLARVFIKRGLELTKEDYQYLGIIGFFLMMVTIFFVLPMALIVYIVGSLVEWIIRRTT